MLQTERYRNTTELAARAAASVQSMNPDQLELYNVIMELVLRQDRAAVVIPRLCTPTCTDSQRPRPNMQKKRRETTAVKVRNPTFY
jgi:hypothetical protein